jgi:hypothetical protein
MGRKQFEELVPFQYVSCLIGFRHGHPSESVKNCSGPGSESQGGTPRQLRRSQKSVKTSLRTRGYHFCIA